ncbi:MAG TPA: ATP-binding cassette domain-containing protein [Conexibacter sp.]|nr:ATP-binding cassette domain-containing protein [Conexibacter sp.]
MLLSLEHVAKTHWVGPYEKPTLVDVSLSLAPGDFVGIYGGRRAGKSTLLRLSAGLDVPDRGVVRFDGIDLATLSRARLGARRLREIGIAAGGGPRSIELTVADYVALPLMGERPAVVRHRVRDALQRVGVLECREATWPQLSDSERMLASVAHAIVRRPRLLLADDLVVRLDASQDHEVVALLVDHDVLGLRRARRVPVRVQRDAADGAEPAAPDR